jgi:tetratricopeptide (TPR) repeat protein
MYEDFVKEHPTHSQVVTAAYWIGKAMVHTGKGDEAKKFIADTIRKYIDDPHRDAVDQLITQLALLCVHKKRVPTPSPAPAPAITSGTSAVAAAKPVPTPTPVPAATPAEVETDPGAELDALLGSAEQDASPTAKARILFAKGQLAFLRRQIPEEEKNYAIIADKFKPEDLSSVILAMVGDYLMFKGQTDKAQSYYQYLLDEFPKSDVLDYAYNGLGQIAYDKKDYAKALKYYTDAIDKGAAAQKFKDLTIGKARTLLALGRLDEAKKVFEEVASNRDWRGPLTAESLCSMGDIAQKQADGIQDSKQKQAKLAEAIAYYQRVFVAYQRYLPWVAKAYIASGQCFEKMDKVPEAVNTYREMLHNEKLAAFPEADVAKQRLQLLGAQP